MILVRIDKKKRMGKMNELVKRTIRIKIRL